MSLRRRVRLFTFACVFSAVVAAQAQSGPPICTVSSSLPLNVHAEGLTELAGTTLIDCVGGIPTAVGKPVPMAMINFTLNTNVTNRLVAGSNIFTDALLTIDNPSGASVRQAQISNASTVSPDAKNVLGTGTGVDFTTGAVPNTWLGTLINVNTVSFTVPFDAGMKDRIYRITNIRANGAALGLGPGTAPVKLVGTVSIIAVPGPTVNNPTQTVGLVQPSLRTGVLAGTSAPGNTSFNTNITAASTPVFNTPNVAQLVFRPLYAGALSTPTGGDFGIRLKAAFNNIPSGVNVFVSNNTGNANGGNAKIITPPLLSTSNGISQVPSGSPVVVWENQDNLPGGSRDFIFGAWSSWSGSSAAPIPGSNTSVALSFSPGYPAYTAFNRPNGSLPIPRFSDVFVQSQVVNTVLTGGSSPPALSDAFLDSRTCYLGVDFYYPLGNSCSAGQTPYFGVTSDTRAISPTFSVTPDGGVNLNVQTIDGQLITGMTPLNGLATATANGVAPGSYRPLINVSYPGSPSLAIPIPVVVLPSNSPVLIPQGFTDAASYENGIVYPGQIFTAFPSSFGPVSGVFSASLDETGSLPNNLGGAQMFFDGTPGSMLFIANGQMAGIAPFNLAGKATTQVQVKWNFLMSPPITLPVGKASLSILSSNASGGGQGAILNQDGTLNSPSNPAAASSIVTFFVTYAGPLDTPGTDGRTTAGPPYPAPVGPVTANIGGVNAPGIAYAGNVPTGVESFMQFNVTVPASVRADSSVPVILGAGGVTNLPTITMAVK